MGVRNLPLVSQGPKLTRSPRRVDATREVRPLKGLACQRLMCVGAALEGWHVSDSCVLGYGPGGAGWQKCPRDTRCCIWSSSLRSFPLSTLLRCPTPLSPNTHTIRYFSPLPTLGSPPAACSSLLRTAQGGSGAGWERSSSDTPLYRLGAPAGPLGPLGACWERSASDMRSFLPATHPRSRPRAGWHRSASDTHSFWLSRHVPLRLPLP